MNIYKIGDAVKYKGGGDDRTFYVLALYGNDYVGLSLADYDDTEQDEQMPISAIELIK